MPHPGLPVSEVEGDLCTQMKKALPHRFGVVPDQNTRLFAAHPVSYILAYTACDPAELPLSRFGDPKPTATSLLTTPH
jgi:hypothetical protein